MSASVLYDTPGPRGRLQIRIGSTIAVGIIAVLTAVAISRLADRHQLDAARWNFVTQASILRYLFFGLLSTLKVAFVAGVLALTAGALLAVGRLAPSIWVRAAATSIVQFCRAIPLLPLIFFIGLGFPVMGLKFPAFWFLVIGLALYNSAVFAEIFRAGVVSLHQGQREAAQALGLTFGQTMRLVLLPQAIRRMVPALVSQYVVLLKDSSLGYVLPYMELLRRGEITGQYSHSVLQSYVVVAIVYIAVNASLSYVARRLERRQRGQARAVVGAAPEPEAMPTLTDLGPLSTVGSGTLTPGGTGR